MHTRTKLSTAVIAIMASMASSQGVQAQEQANENQEYELIQVKGIRASMARAMDVKRESGGVVDAISAEDIGKFPDTNLAESLQRITGVSIDRSGGEGQLITVRGFGPEFNTVLVNGRQIASENNSRAFSFDTIASELVNSLDVHKTSTATMQSGGIGSTINIRTARPFSIDGFKIAGSVKGVFDDNSDETTPQVSGLISNTFDDDRFGVLLAVSHQERDTRLNQAQIDGWLENVGIPNPQTQSGEAWEGNIFSPRNYDHKVTFEDRKRTNANLVFQYAASDDITITADVLYSDFDIETDATSYGHWFTAPNIQGVGDDGSLFDENGNRRAPTVDANGTIVDLYQEVGLATDMHSKTFDRLTETTDFGLNLEWQVNDNLNLTFDAHVSEAEREANNGGENQLSLIGYANRVRFQVDDNILPFASMFAEANPNIYSGQQEIEGAFATSPDGFPGYDPTLTPDGVSDFLDTANSRAHVMLRRGWEIEDEVSQFKIDGEWDEGQDTGLVKAKFGMQYSKEEKELTRWDNDTGVHCLFCGYPDAPAIPADMQYIFDAGNDFLSSISGSGRMPTQWLAHDGEAQFAFLEQIAGQSFDAIRRDNSFEIEEEIISAYLEFDFVGDLANSPIYISAGVRMEKTDVDVSGTQAALESLTVLDATELNQNYGTPQIIDESSDYDVTLPNVSIKWEFTDDLIFRMAASQTLTRPTLESMSPAVVITTSRQGGDLRSFSGNASLRPFKSDNFDVSAEWYYGDASYASAGYFKKEVSNFIVNGQTQITFTDSNGNPVIDPSTGEVASFTNVLPSNGEDASVDGFELAWQHTFDSGFGFITNATYVDSDADLDPDDINQVFALTGLSDSLNLVGFYENGPFQIRLAWNWRDEFVQSLTQVQGNGPTIVEDYEQLDISGSYDITDNLTVFFEGINLTEEFVHKRGRYSNHLLLAEDSGRRWAVGVRGSF
ncbi:TonB-dependent receptor [Alteromonas sp. a30]|uniref:TonB-dependent receptor n=1 Tax=Alteromonas sp. a30 TaxID=2730917 RepID=UPI0022805404|nr:TonB-dependent receptor [Alteromonas sp. a30]MCY7297326.1 TonB-dependent receptor [Alteromonas sp. a30]